MNFFGEKTFNWVDMGIVKLCLIAFGIILGVYFFEYVNGLIWLWWSLFGVTAVWLLWTKVIKD